MTASEATQASCTRAGDRVLVAVSVLLAITSCVPALITLSHTLRVNEFYGHAYLIPATAAFLAWAERARIREALRVLMPPRRGPWVAFAAGAFMAGMVIGDVRFLSGLGVPILLAATAYAVGGERLLRPLVLPLAFLAAMVPPPGFLTREVLMRLKLFVTDVAVSILHHGGYAVLAEGNRISVPGHTLFVADACTGLTSIITLFPFALVIAYFMSRDMKRRCLIVASVVPLAVGANVFRVAVTVTMVSSWGEEFAQGVLHSSFGVATYAIGTLALVGFARLLR